MNILCVGDVYGKPGRRILRERLPALIERYSADCVIVNGENAAGGRGITPKVADELLALPIDVVTSGNHIWQHAQLGVYLTTKPILRPHNRRDTQPGRGMLVVVPRCGQAVGVLNLQGRINMYEPDLHSNPFIVAPVCVAQLRASTAVIIVDFHAEATSEKQALARHLEGTVSCVYGTHTHVQTADERILPKGTAYITDIGMTGGHDSIVGMEVAPAVQRFVTEEKTRGVPAEGGCLVQGICVAVDAQSGSAQRIERFQAE